jgi:hypothetical protein
MFNRAFVFGSSVFLALTFAARGQGDPTQIFNGVWVAVNPPGPHVVFNVISLGQREASLPVLGQATIGPSNGEDGSNFRISGPGFTCFYLILTTSQRTRMVWELKSGPELCFKSASFEQADNPVAAAVQPPPAPVVRPQVSILPSFACSGRLNATERTLCSDSNLAQLDQNLDALYTSAQAYARANGDSASSSRLAAAEKSWLVNDRNACATDTTCLASAYSNRISQLRACVSRLRGGSAC